MQEHTILGVKLRRLIISIVNGMGRGDHIRVQFRGTRAYTDGRNISLPAIRDLAEIPYGTARALIGYAIHEVAHIRYTDFEAIIRAIEAGKMEPDALVKKFENAIEDYRIERTISAELPGTASDLTALRNLIHPDLRKLSLQWLADPRACGPLALTWTGSVLNGFVIPAMQDTLDAFPAPVRALIDNWTARMKDVQSTEEVVDLAIAFTAEANAYAAASRQQPSCSDDEQTDENGVDQDDAVSTSADANQPDDADADHNHQSANKETGSNETADDHTADEDAAADAADCAENSDGAAGSDTDAESTSDQSAEEGAHDPNSNSNDGGDAGQAGQQNTDQSDNSQVAPGQEGQNSSEGDLDSAKSTAEAASSDQSDEAQGSSNGSSTPCDVPGNSKSNDTDSQEGEQSSSEEGVDNLSFGSQAASGPSLNSGQSPSGQRGQIDMDNSMPETSPNADPTNAQQTTGADNSPASADPDDASSSSENSASAARNCDGQDPDASRQSDDATADPHSQENNLSDTDGGDDQTGEDDTGDPLKDILDENAAFDDLMDDLRDYIAGNPLPDIAPDATDGEVDPEAVLEDIKGANAVAPNYTSQDPEPSADQSEGSPHASKHHYADSRFVPIDATREEDNQYATLKSNAAGVINTTARTIRRLLMAEEQRGVLRGRRDGQFDIRNISAIVRGTGNCYKRRWERPAPETHLTILTDFSGSMVYGSGEAEPRALAITGALAIEEATRGTQIETSIYGFQGLSPHVVLYPFKEGKQAATLTRRNIGAYRSLQLGCTPTGEAMAAMGEILDEIVGKRRILLVLTDGTADDTSLCKSVVPVLRRRGIEVVAIGIQCDAVTEWCEDSHVIHDINQLPQALLSTIDPRAQKKLRKAA